MYNLSSFPISMGDVVVGLRFIYFTGWEYSVGKHCEMGGSNYVVVGLGPVSSDTTPLHTTPRQSLSL